MRLTCQRYAITLRNTPFFFSLGYSRPDAYRFSLFNSSRTNFHRKRANYFITNYLSFFSTTVMIIAIRFELNQKSPISYRTVQFLHPIYSTHVHLNRAVHRSHRQFAIEEPAPRSKQFERGKKIRSIKSFDPSIQLSPQRENSQACRHLEGTSFDV